jgi:ArsR family transcriptional regulator, arsenate/arsenite/antimonite-responsive transcriptional repressor
MTTRLQVSRPVQRLVQLGVCSTSDIKDAMAEAEKLSSPEFSKKIRDAERLLGILGDSNRIKILMLLSKREMCVCEIESALKLPQPTVSHHLGLLEQAGLLERSKRARWVFYKVNDSPILDAIRGIVQSSE